MTAQLTAAYNGSVDQGLVNVDTIVPLGQSYRTVVNTSTSAQRGLLSWPVTISAGTNVSFVGSNSQQLLFVTPLVTVQSSSKSCGAEGTQSAATALPTPSDRLSSIAADRGPVVAMLLMAVIGGVLVMLSQ